MTQNSSSRQHGVFRTGTKTVTREVLIPESLMEVIEELEDEITGMGTSAKYIGVNNAAQMLAEALSDDYVRFAIFEYIDTDLSRSTAE